MPGFDGLGDSDWREGFVLFADCVASKPFAPAEGVEADQTFFDLISIRIWNTSWMMLLLLRGDRAINSEAAATQIQKAGWDRKSMASDKRLSVQVYCAVTQVRFEFCFRRYDFPSRRAMWITSTRNMGLCESERRRPAFVNKSLKDGITSVRIAGST